MFVSPRPGSFAAVLSLAATIAVTVACSILSAPQSAQARPAVLTASAVAAPDAYGARAARDVLKAGGNAVDAAVATAFTLAVTYPEAGNLGGGGFMMLYVKGKPYFLDYRETAPAGASAKMYLDAKGDPIVDLSLTGALSSGIPGTVRGLAEAHKRFGKLSWARDLRTAIAYARNGIVFDHKMELAWHGADDAYAGKTNFARYFGGMRAGKRLVQPELAATLEEIARDGDKAFYEGRIADLIVAQMGRGAVHGLITKADLAGYKAAWREPIQGQWKGYTVITAPPPSSGGVALLQLLGMKADAANLFKGVPLNSAQYLHLISEIEKPVFADRAEYMGDPDFVKTPVAALTDPAYLVRRAAAINPARPSPTPSIKPGLEKPQTTHFSIVDRWGNAVSNTYTLNGNFGAGTVVEGAGFLLNDEMDDFSVKPGAPNQFGVVGGDANAISPGKRPLSSMTPTILLKDGNVAMVIGTPGGSRIFTWVFQVLTDVYDYGLPLAEAQKQMRFHHQLLPENTIFSEPYAPISPELEAQMKARGYVIERQDWTGDMEAIQILGKTPVAVSDPRQRGVAVVVR